MLQMFYFRKEYVDALIDYIFNKSVKDQFEAFSDGFHRVTGGQVLVRISNST